MTKLDATMSFKRLGRRACHTCVSSTPSEIPYVGFSPVRLQTGIRPRPSPRRPGVKPRAGIRPGRINLYATRAYASGSCGPLGHAGGTRGMGDPVQRSFAASRVMLSRRVIATMTSSETLGTSRRLICFVLAGLCPTALSGPAPRGSPICSTCLFFRAAVRTPVDMVTAHDRSFVTTTGLRLSASDSASTGSPSPTLRGCVTRLQRSLHATARKIAGPPSARTFTTELSPRRVAPSECRL